jgi:Domain of unknown function (DUF3943)
MKCFFCIFSAFIFAVSGTLAAKEKKAEYLIQVAVPHIIQGNRNFELSKLYCQELEFLIRDIEKKEIKCECIYKNEKISDQYKSDFNNFIKITKSGCGHHVDAEIINSQSLAEGLKFNWQTSDEFKDVKKLVARFINYRNENCLLELEKAAFLAFKSSYESSGDFEGVVQESEKKYVRSILEIAGILGGGSALYQLFDFSGDSDFDLDWNGFKEKFSSRSFRFDDNHRMYNFYAHPLIGSVYYQVGRTNGFTPAESFLTAFAASALWEFIAEFSEVSSINDQFQTAFAGSTIGEASFQLSNFYRVGGDTVFNRILAEIFDPMASFHNWIDGERIKRTDNVDQFGMNDDFWHRINIYAKAAEIFDEIDPGKLQSSLGFNMQVSPVKGMMEPGKKHKVEFDILFVEIASELGLEGRNKQDFLFYAKSVFMGLVSKNIRETQNKKKEGYGLIFGLSSAYDLSEGELKEKFDKMAVVNVLGSTFDVSFFLEDVVIRLSLDIFADFTSVSSMVIEDYRKEHIGQEIRATLAKNQYYNGFGYTQSGKFEVAYKNIGSRVRWRYNHVNSIQGYERNQDVITQDFQLRDNRGVADFQLYLLVPKYGLNFGLGYEMKYGSSEIYDLAGESSLKSYETTQRDQCGYITLGFEF